MTGPTDEEQYYLELINEARLDPLGNAARYISSYAPLTSPIRGVQSALTAFGVSGSALFNAYSALATVAPLAWNENLAQAARGHTAAMIASDTQTHQAPGEAALGQRLDNAGYTGWTRAAENVYAFAEDVLYGHAGFMVDWGGGPDGMQSPPGHRNAIMNPLMTEIGIGVTLEGNPSTSVGPQVVTQDFGTRGRTFILGVAYTDGDGDAFYTPGEGRGDLAVAIGGVSTTSTDSGGYALDMTGLTNVSVKLSGGGLAGDVTVTLASAAANAKIDVVNGNSLRISTSATVTGIGEIHGIGITGLTLTGGAGDQSIIGTGGGDTLAGAAGADRLVGGAGDDVLDGGAGGDMLDGGAGVDVVSYAGAAAGVSAYLTWEAGGAGDAAGDRFVGIENMVGSSFADVLSGDGGGNKLDGGDGNDWLLGQEGDDQLIGGNGNDVLTGGLGADSLVGGADIDVAAYREATASTYSLARDGAKAGLIDGHSYGVSVDMVDKANGYGEAAGDSYSEIENIWGSHFDDIMRGDDNGGQVYGFEGNDVLDGRGGDDNFYGGTGADAITMGAGADISFYLSWNDHVNVYGTPEPYEGGDTYTDFKHGEDRIVLSRYWFGFGNIPGPAAALTSEYADFLVDTTTPTSTKPTLIWDSVARTLSFDADGTGATAAVLLGTFQAGATMTLGDIWTA